MARIAPSAQAILDQASLARPRRSRASDGTLGNADHRRRKSDHNPGRGGYVHAADLTHDPGDGMDAHGWIRWRVARGDWRIKLAISNGQIWYPDGRGWRRYSGENPHRTHAHVSIRDGAEFDTSSWFTGWFTALPPASIPPPPVPRPPPTPPPPPGPWPVPAPTILSPLMRKVRSMLIIHAPNDGTMWWWTGDKRRWIVDGPEREHYERVLRLMGSPYPDPVEWAAVFISRIPIDRDAALPPGHPPLPPLRHP